MPDDAEKRKLDRIKAYAVKRYKEKLIALSRLESEIQKMVAEFAEIYNVKILDAWLEDDYLIHLDTNL